MKSTKFSSVVTLEKMVKNVLQAEVGLYGSTKFSVAVLKKCGQLLKSWKVQESECELKFRAW